MDVSRNLPTGMEIFDGFDVDEIDEERWTKKENGSTTVKQASGELIFENLGEGSKGITYYESVNKYGKNWRITTDIKLEQAIPSAINGAIAATLMLFKDVNNYIKIGPLKTNTIDCNCYMWVKTGEETLEIVQPLVGDVTNTTEFSNYTIIVLHDAIAIACNGIILTMFQFKELYNYSIVLSAETNSSTDVMTAKMNDFEALNSVDITQMKLGEYIKDTYKKVDDIIDRIGTSITNDISGNMVLDSKTEVFLTFNKATYGKKFKVNLFGDLEGQRIQDCVFSPAGGTLEDLTEMANNLVSNSIKLCQLTGPAVNDAIHFAGSTPFKRLDIYMEGGTQNTDNTYVWEYWNGSAWTTLAVTDGTLYNGKVFGKSGSVTWTATLQKPPGWGSYPVRARITTKGSSKPKATHIQISEVGQNGFDANAAFLSSLTVSIYRKREDGSWGTLPTEIGLPYTQCILYKSIGISDLPCWSDTKIGFKLSETPVNAITIPYSGYVETVEE